MDNNRRHQRLPLSVKVKISHPQIGVKIVSTQNISDSGLFVLVEPTEMPPIGTVVIGQVQGMLEDPPLVNMKIVRVEKAGLGLQFIDD